MDIQKTYLFYDLETTGLSKCFDQVLQFAAIRTDMSLKELERYEIRIRLNPDIIPNPYALIVHRINPKEQNNALPEWQAIPKIHAILNQPGTLSLGYNTLGFDDEFLRFSFYRNLLPPYTHQYQNQCSRLDLFPMLIMFYLFKPEVLNWPIVDDKISFKLEQLGRANQCMEGHAHDAMVDVEATLALAKRCFEEHDMWQYLTDYFNKSKDTKRLLKLPKQTKIANRDYACALLIQSRFGVDNAFQSQAVLLGEHRHYKNQTIWLRLDDQLFSDISSEELIQFAPIVRKKSAEAPFVLPLKKRFTKHRTAEKMALAEENIAWLSAHPDQFKKIRNYHLDFTYPTIPNLDVEAALYQNNFPNRADSARMAEFHRAKLKKKITIADQFNARHLRDLAHRLLARMDIADLDESFRSEYEAYINSIFRTDEQPAPIDYRGNSKLTVANALELIGQILDEETLDADQTQLLEALRNDLREKTSAQVVRF